MEIIAVYLVFAMLAVIYFDLTRFIIPNWLVGSLLILYPLAVWLTPGAVDWQMALLGMVIVFFVGYVIFALKLMGGGDIKLLTVCALWVGFKPLYEFIIITAILGGAMCLALLFIRKFLAFILKRSIVLPRILRPGEPVAYGVAIACAFLYFLSQGKIPGIAALYLTSS